MKTWLHLYTEGAKKILETKTSFALFSRVPGIFIKIFQDKKIFLKKFNTSSWRFSENYSKYGKFRKIVKEDGTVVSKKVTSGIKVSVIDQNGQNLVMLLEEAQNIARRKNLELVKLDDKGVKPVYQFLKTSQLLGLETNFKEANKGSTKKLKRIILKTQALQHDVNTKVNQALKLLENGHKVVVELINSGSDHTKLENLVRTVEKGIGEKFKLNQNVNIKSKSAARLEFLPSLNSADAKSNVSKEDKTSKSKLREETSNHETQNPS